MLDGCFSGAYLAENLQPANLVEGVAPARIAPEADTVPAKVSILAAGTALQYANWDELRGHRLFGYHVARGLLEGHYDLVELASYVRTRVACQSKASFGADRRQTPTFVHRGKLRDFGPLACP